MAVAPKNTVVVDEPSTADLARTRHARRQLEAALDHSIALLAALGLPRLVDAEFDPFDRTAVDFAVRQGIAALDAIDAPQEDLEDDGTAEEEPDAEDGGDKEPSLGSPEPTFGHLGASVSQIGWMQSGLDDLERDDDSGIGDLDGYHEQCGYATAGALPWSVGGHVA